jgi:hypothetical protein
MPSSFLDTANQYFIGTSSTSSSSLWESFVDYLRQSEDAPVTLSLTIPTSDPQNPIVSNVPISSQDYLDLVSNDADKMGSLLTLLSKDVASSINPGNWPSGTTSATISQLMTAVASQVVLADNELTSPTLDDVGEKKGLITVLTDAINAAVAHHSITSAQGQFLKNYYLTPLSQMLSSMNVQYQKIYMSFLNTQVSAISQSEAANALSPTEVTARHMMYTIMDILITLMKDAAAVQLGVGKAIQILAGRNLQYSKLASNAVFYFGSGEVTKELWDTDIINDSSSNLMSSTDRELTRTTPNTDPTQYSLGYGDIKLADVFKSLYSNLLTTDASNGQSFDLFSATYKDYTLDKQRRNKCHISLAKVVGSNGLATLTAEVTFTSETLTDSTWTADYTKTTTVPIPPALQGQGPVEQQIVIDKLNEAFQATYADAKANKYVEISKTDLTAKEQEQNATAQDVLVARRDIKIPWLGGSLMGHVYDTSGKLGVYLTTAQSTRGTVNRRIGSYLDAIKSKIDLLKDKSDQLQQVQDAASTSRQQTVSLIQSTMRQLQNLITSTFR